MENKKLINILIKDMLEMEDLIESIKLNQSYEPLEINFLQTRAKGIRELLELLGNKNSPKIEESVTSSPKKKEVIVEAEEKIEEPVIPKVEPEEINKAEPEESSEVLEEESPQHDKTVEEESQKPEEKKMIEENNIKKDCTKIEKKELPTEQEISLAEEENKKEKQTLGDSFVKEKSLNDTISDSSENLEYKLSHRPVSSLKSSIGINDRFLFTRELFDGDGEQFNKAIKTLDSFNTIQEAVNYLRDSYQWKKNDTSLKFIDLVKRRYNG